MLILAGGWGTRLGNLSEIIPKPMVKIGRMPIIWHIMKIYSHYGYNDFIICLGVKAGIIKDFFFHFEKNNDFTIDLTNGSIEYHNKQEDVNWKVTLIDTGINTLKGGRIKRVEEFLDPDSNLLTYGDGVADINIPELIKFHESHGKIITISGVHTPSRFGEIVEESGKVLSFKEKPQTSVGLINGGFMVFKNELLKYLTPAEDCDFEISILEDLAKKGEVMVYKHEGEWECMDHERDVNHLNKLWNKNQAFWKVW